MNENLLPKTGVDLLNPSLCVLVLDSRDNAFALVSVSRMYLAPIIA